MKKITLSAFAFLLVSIGMAQVHVVNDAFIYSKGTDIFITKEIGLRDTDSKFYVRNEAQIIQEDATIGNTGNGSFSVFQEGVANNFTYNYWSSPVSDPSTVGSNGGFKNSQIFFPTLTKDFTSGTDLVVNANSATILPTNFRDGLTDKQEFDAMGDPVIKEGLRIASRWLYSYNSVGQGAGGGGGYFGWRAFANSAEVVLPGYGFTMKGVNFNSNADEVNIKTSTEGDGQRYDFRGIPNSGTFTVGVDTDDFSLVGNPYPSALDLKAVMEDVENRNNIDGEIYFWDSASTTHILEEYVGGYGVYVPDVDAAGDGMYTDATFIMYDNNGIPIPSSSMGGGAISPVGDMKSRRYAPIGQGFVIQRTSDDPATSDVEGDFVPGSGYGFIKFKNEHRAFVRENDNNSIFKSAPNSRNDQVSDVNAAYVRPKIRLNAFINNQYNRNMILAFGNDATLGWDWGKDGSNNANRVDTDIYMPIESRQAIIQTMPEITDETAVPINLKSAQNNATFEIGVTSFENFDTEQVLIHDKQTNTYHDILNDSFTIQTEQGEVKDRYEIVFQEKTTLSNGNVTAADTFNIFQNNDRSLLTILNPASKNIADISVFDLAGRLVAQKNPKDSNQEYTFNTSAYAVGIYVVKVTTNDDEEMARKVSVSN